MTTEEYLDTLIPTADAYEYDGICDNNNTKTSFAEFLQILANEKQIMLDESS